MAIRGVSKYKNTYYATPFEKESRIVSLAVSWSETPGDCMPETSLFPMAEDSWKWACFNEPTAVTGIKHGIQ